jgi:hypothetical protein
LTNTPEAVLQEEGVLSEVELVLRRHDIANVILNLEEKIQNIKIDPLTAESDSTEKNPGKKPKNKIVLSKIAKDKQQIRRKNELVSFQCFMQENELDSGNIESNLRLKDTDFLVRTRYFPLVESKGESQISMYKEFSKLLENRFHYSQLTSRSDINFAGESGGVSNNPGILKEPSYLFSRLEMLDNVDIFLGNNWVLEREDLLAVYPYHVHLQNYVESFRAEYRESRGRL